MCYKCRILVNFFPFICVAVIAIVDATDACLVFISGFILIFILLLKDVDNICMYVRTWNNAGKENNNFQICLFVVREI